MNMRIILVGMLVCMARSASTKIRIEVEENLLPGSLIMTLSTHPEVTGSMRREDLPILTYLLIEDQQKHSANASYYVSVEKYSGSVTVTNILDREVICPDNPEVCILSCSILITPVYYRMITLEIVVKDVNDHPPVFSMPMVSLNISERVVVNTKYQLPSATDKDTEAFGVKNYTISPIPGLEGSDYVAKKFSLVQRMKNLELVVRESLNLNEDRALNPDQDYSFYVVATDKGNPPLQGRMEVKVHIHGENNNDPVFGKTFYEGSVSEDAEVGTDILTVSAMDFDKGINGKVFYNFLEKNANFAIDENTGLISLKSKLDREETSRYELQVEARDGGTPSRTATATVTIAVQDVNDNKPTISFIYLDKEGLWENSRPPVPVVLVTVIDGDDDLNGYVKCQLNEGSEFFGLSVEPTSPERSLSFNNKQRFFISSTSVLDSETTRRVDVTLVCRDSPMDGKSQVSSVVIPVKVLDINDNDPVFSSDTYNMSILENAAAGAVAGKVFASDLDEGPNAQLTYKLSNDSADFFSVDPSTGEIKSRVVFDREAVSSYELKVVASDSGSPSRSSTATVFVKILDVDDNLPAFEQTEYVFPIPNFSKPDTVVGTIRATDADEGENAIVEFRVVKDSTECSEISIDSRTGRLYANQQADAKRCKAHNFRVEAKNPNSDKSSFVSVTVFVREPTDNEPVFAFPSVPDNDSVVLKYPVYENQEVAKLSVASGTPAVTYALLKTTYICGRHPDASISKQPECLNTMFDLDETTGSITLDPTCLEDLKPLPNSTFELRVRAAVAKMPFLRTESTLKLSFSNLPAKTFNIASLGSNPNFVIILAVVASTILLVVTLSSIIVCLVLRSRRHKSKGSEVKYKMCCKVSPPVTTTTITTEGKNGGGMKDQVANGLLEAKFQRGNSSSASTLYDRDSSSSDSGRGPSESDFQPINNILSRRPNVPLVGLATLGQVPLKPDQGQLTDQALYSGSHYPVHQQSKSPVHSKASRIYQQPGLHYVEGASDNPRFQEGRYPASPSDPYGGQQRSRTSSVQSLRPPLMASLEDFDQLDAQGVRNSKRVLGRRDLKRSSMILSPKNQQATEDAGAAEGKTRVTSHEGLDGDQFSQSYSPFYYPNRNGMKNSLPKNGTGSRCPPPYASAAVRPPKHVTFDDTLTHLPTGVVQREYLPPVGSVANSSASSGSYNVRKADTAHNSPVSFVLV